METKIYQIWNYQRQPHKRDVVPVVYDMARNIVLDGRDNYEIETPLKDASVERKFKQLRKTGTYDVDMDALVDECARMDEIQGNETFLTALMSKMSGKGRRRGKR